jgi:hypothetical protein
MTNKDPEILDYLGCGMRADYPAFPETSAATMRPTDMIALQKQILPKAVKGLAIAFTKKILPAAFINTIRKSAHRAARP